MDFKKEQLNNFLEDRIKTIFKIETLKKVITKPWRIPVAIKEIYTKINVINNDVKLKSLSTDYLLNTITASLKTLSTLSTKFSTAKQNILTIKDVYGENAINEKDSIELSALFKSHGSDKSTDHDYYIAYASILKEKKEKDLNILEIGLGTNNIDVMSNMGTYGKPGASLRSFRDMYNNANVFGADIDKRILFTEDRIKTFFVDQTNPSTFIDLKNELMGLQFDLIIDDGLHNSQANLNTTYFALDLLKPDGTFVIEDINVADFQYYQILEAILIDKFTVDFIQTKSKACICVFKKK